LFEHPENQIITAKGRRFMVKTLKLLLVSSLVMFFGLVGEPSTVNISINRAALREFPTERLLLASLQVCQSAYVPEIGDKFISWNSNYINFVFQNGELGAFVPWEIPFPPVQFDFPRRIVSENTLFLAAYNGVFPSDLEIANKLKSIERPRELWVIQAHAWALVSGISRLIGVPTPPSNVRLMFLLMLIALASEMWKVHIQKN